MASRKFLLNRRGETSCGQGGARGIRDKKDRNIRVCSSCPDLVGMEWITRVRVDARNIQMNEGSLGSRAGSRLFSAP